MPFNPTATSNNLPAYFPPTSDPAVADCQAKLRQLNAKLGQQLIAPGDYMIGSTKITVNAQGQIVSIVNS
jgi:hypothetical protein